MSTAQNAYSASNYAAITEFLDMIRRGEVDTKNLELQKVLLARRHRTIKILKNAEIFALADKNDRDYAKIRSTLKTKPVRTGSGVANISVMWLDKSRKSPHEPEKFYSCPASCIYCAQGSVKEDGTIIQAPKSYTGCEPTTMRAIRNDFDPFRQVANRINQFRIIGHDTDKCELIIMGGTFTATTPDYQEEFVKRCLDAMNGTESESMESAQTANEAAENRCIGLTIETRADFCSDHHVNHMLEMGCTRVEIGVQSTKDDVLRKINRGHDTGANIEAIACVKRAGLKFTSHFMPGLTGLFGEIDEKQEMEDFRALFDNPAYRPDELKIYPTLVLPGTHLYELWTQGKYTPLTSKQMLSMLIEMQKIVPPYVRIKRVMRDISEHEASAGASTTNLRQLADDVMRKRGERCRCIRCREVGFSKAEPDIIELIVEEYEASGGKEVFLSFEDVKNDILLGFLRLRLDKGTDTARIREVHVYGKMTPIGEKSKQMQHRGLGKKLIEKAEGLAKEKGYEKITVTSGVGVRGYYRKLGYVFDKPYMVRQL